MFSLCGCNTKSASYTIIECDYNMEILSDLDYHLKLQEQNENQHIYRETTFQDAAGNMIYERYYYNNNINDSIIGHFIEITDNNKVIESSYDEYINRKHNSILKTFHKVYLDKNGSKLLKEDAPATMSKEEFLNKYEIKEYNKYNLNLLQCEECYKKTNVWGDRIISIVYELKFDESFELKFKVLNDIVIINNCKIEYYYFENKIIITGNSGDYTLNLAISIE